VDASSAQAADFLAQQLPLQQGLVVSYRLSDATQVWLKKAGARHGMWGYRVLGLIARLSRMPALRPVPNLGGQAAIATEVQRLRSLAAAGVRVPQVLAVMPQGFVMGHLGAAGQHCASLDAEMAYAAQTEQAQGVLDVWLEGLSFIAQVHRQGQCLSQAFARNIVRCADGQLGAIDFEDDPSSALPLPLCQLRDVLAYQHSTALYLREANVLDAARSLWQNWLTQAPELLRQNLAATLPRMAWLRHLPTDRRWGRDAQRLRAAYDLLES
jgi:hypothetical protein